jgi:hypothetical protein
MYTNFDPHDERLWKNNNNNKEYISDAFGQLVFVGNMYEGLWLFPLQVSRVFNKSFFFFLNLWYFDWLVVIYFFFFTETLSD